MTILIRPLNGRYTLFLNGVAVMQYANFETALKALE